MIAAKRQESPSNSERIDKFLVIIITNYQLLIIEPVGGDHTMASQAPLEPINVSPQTAEPVHRTIGAKTGPQGPAIRRLAGAMNAGPRALQLKAAAEAIGKGRPAVLPNRTGLPGNLKRGIESLSGMSLDQVRVRYNSDRPERIDAEAYAQGSEIHVAPGAERHLPHEAWHVVQQAQGRVKPTMQLKGGVPVNDDCGLEKEADLMGAKAASLPTREPAVGTSYTPPTARQNTQLKRKSLRARVAEKLARANKTNTPANLTARETRLAPPLARSPRVGFGEALTSEIERRRLRRMAEGKKVANDIRGGDRPVKPTALSQKDGKADLTAHHLLPYNQIRDSFATAVEGHDLTAMQNVLAFSGKSGSDSSEAYRALAFQQEYTPKKAKKENLSEAERKGRADQAKKEKQMGITPFQKTLSPVSSKQSIKELFKATTWASHNVFMGPAPEHRLDDPKEGLDARYTPQGQLTKSSVMAREISKKGFSGMHPVDFSLSVQSARNEADGPAALPMSGLAASDTAYGPRKGGLRTYKASDWTTVGGKKVQIGKIEARNQDSRYQKWAGKNNWQKLQQLGYINDDEAKQIRTNVAVRRKKKRSDYASGIRSRD
jgi:hypothetical protein